MTSPLRDEPQQWVRDEPVAEVDYACLNSFQWLGALPPEGTLLYTRAAPKDSKHIERAMKLVHEIAAFKWSEGLSDGNFDKSGARNANKEADELMTELRALLEGGGSE